MFLVKNGQLADVIPYPSPCDPTKQPVSIRYVLSEESEVTINIYDQSGTLIKNLVEKQNRLPGVQEENWFGDNFAGLSLANGIYFCEIVVKNTKGQYRHYTPLAIFRR
jgi:flagellar hook assembly protein FlgD